MTTLPDLAMWTLGAPLLVVLILVIARPVRHLGTGAALISVLAAIVNLAASLRMAAGVFGSPDIEDRAEVTWLIANGEIMSTVGVHIDGISASMMAVVAVVAVCVQVFSMGYLADEPKRDFGRYFLWQSLFLFSMNALVLAPNLLQLFMAWELVGVCSYLLIGYWFTKPSAAEAALKAFWMMRSMILLSSIS